MVLYKQKDAAATDSLTVSNLANISNSLYETNFLEQYLLE